MKFRRHFFLEKNRFIALLLLLVLFAGVYLLRNWYQNQGSAPAQDSALPVQSLRNPSGPSAPFDPNDFTPEDWESIGFTPKQVSTIMKYKDVVGGRFLSKSQLKKCYAISEEKYEQIEPFLLLPQTHTHRQLPAYFHKEKKKISVFQPFNPDVYTAKDWEKIGFSPAQAKALIKYKNYLGGRFISKQNFKESFVVSEEIYAQLSPYLLLPEKSPITSEQPNAPKPTLQPFDPNTLDVKGWQGLGFTEKQARSILKYKDNYLKGSFRSLEDMEKNYILRDRFQQLRPYIKLDIETMQPAPKYSSSSDKESNRGAEDHSNGHLVDFSKLDMNDITLQELKTFGFSGKNAAGIISFRKALGGFVHKNQIFETYGIDREIAEKFIQVVPLTTDEVQKYTLITAPESWLKTHPYFRYHADKIIYYRITHSSESKIWRLLKARPDQVAKMKLYLQ